MINVEWHTNEKCENCQQNKPNCAKVVFDFSPDGQQNPPDYGSVFLCSDCVEDLKKRLS